MEDLEGLEGNFGESGRAGNDMKGRGGLEGGVGRGLEGMEVACGVWGCEKEEVEEEEGQVMMLKPLK